MRRRRTHGRRPIPAVVPLLLLTASTALIAVVWRRLAAPRREVSRTSSAPMDVAVAEAAPTRAPDAQPADTGAGPLIHRRYEVDITAPDVAARDVLSLMQRHLTDLAPGALADFEKSVGSTQSFREGDEYTITMLGPWNGTVRVADVSAEHFTLATLDGHPEAGHITFSVRPSAVHEDTTHVLIESWARSRDGLVAAAYGTLGIGKQVQTEVWITFLQRLASLAGATDRPQVRIVTESLTGDDDHPRSNDA